MGLPEARGVLPKRFCGKRGSEIHEKGENVVRFDTTANPKKLSHLSESERCE